MYITIRQQAKVTQITWDDLICGDLRPINWNTNYNKNSGTITRIVEQVNPKVLEKADISNLIDILERFATSHSDLYKAERNSLYYSFKIPKRSGGFRTINAPHPPLMNALNELKSILENEFGALYHTAAFAYVKGRCHVDAIKKHQLNESNWFLKLDFADFFGSISLDFLFKMISMSFPFSEVCKTQRGKEALWTALSLCFLDNKLPQGTPISPLLTNLLMIPIDHRLFNTLAHKRFVYTRYADDMLISCIQAFNFKEIESEIESVLAEFDAPLKIKSEKTRYGSRKGSNWNLGVMLNKDNNITVGHMKKKYFKASICNFILDEQNGKAWDIEEVQTLAGIASYYRSIEPEYFDYVIKHHNQKFHCNFDQMIKQRLING